MKEAHCKRPPRGTPKEVLVALHKSKMMGKFFRRQERGVTEAEELLASRDKYLLKRYGAKKFEAARRIMMTNQSERSRAAKMKELKHGA